MKRRALTLLRGALACAALLSPGARAGSVTGPYLIWMNLAHDAAADQALHDYTHAPIAADTCWSDGALLLVADYAPGITRELVRRALIAREPAAQARLRALLHKGDADLPGYDGVVVVTRGAKPMLVSFGADGRLRTHAAVDRAGHPAWVEAFCEVQPPVLRKP